VEGQSGPQGQSGESQSRGMVTLLSRVAGAGEIERGEHAERAGDPLVGELVGDAAAFESGRDEAAFA
jgi:hypothetical protein